MCTIVMMYRVHAELPLVVAANRDEFYSRKTAGPQVLTERPRVVGGRDLERQGTWMGSTVTGFFAGLTNQRTYGPSDRTKRSRGQVVLDALNLGGADAVDGYLRALEHRAFNPFNLCYGDAGALRVAYVRPDGCEVIALEPGVYVLANDVLRSVAFPKIERAEALMREAPSQAWSALLPTLAATLADHEMPDGKRVPKGPRGGLMPHALLRRLQALCIHTPLYGTVSSTVIALEAGRVAHYLYADGSPCTHPLRDVTSLFNA